MENSDMKDRIAHIIRAKNLTASEFAIRLGIQPSNISHLLSGRNNPSLDFVKKLKETFPEYNLDWIIFGRGPITVSEPFPDFTPMESASASSALGNPIGQIPSGTLFDQAKEEEPVHDLPEPLLSMALKQIVLVYSDNTFEIIVPR